jgi:tetratricopeptide (TPR) repeat protein
MAIPYLADVFVSYSSRNAEWVRGELLPRIEAAGLRAFIDYRDFTRGAPSIKEIERGIRECRKTLLVLTPEYVASEWCELETILGGTLSPANRDLRLIPLLKSPCDLPLRVSALTYVDFTSPDHTLAWRQLLTALGAAPAPPEPLQPTRDEWLLAQPYAMPPNFTGRLSERAMLTRWLLEDAAHPLFVLRALGGFGKSALTWHWLLHDVDPAQWPRVVWWSFYEPDAGMESFLARTLRYLTGADPQSPGARQQVDQLLGELRAPGTLLILDGFERLLRESGPGDALSLTTDTFLRGLASLPLRGKVLLTTRVRPTAVEARGGSVLAGCREEELTQLDRADAVAFFHAEGIRGTRAEIEAACELYGYHPLSLRLLAGLVANDLQQPGDIAAARHLDVSGDLKQRQHHVLEQSYNSLQPEEQQLLGRISCFRGAVTYEALKIFTGGSPQELIARGLLRHDRKRGRFDLHPIVRRYAYDRLAPEERTAAHAALRDYFAKIEVPKKVQTIDELAPLIELYHHTVLSGQYDDARLLFARRLNEVTFFQFGAYELRIPLLRMLFADDEEMSPLVKEPSEQAWSFNELANSYCFNGHPDQGMPLFERGIAIRESQRAESNIAVGLGNMAREQIKTGLLQKADSNFRRCLTLSRNREIQEGSRHRDLGRLLAYTGEWAGSAAELETALAIGERLNGLQLLSVTLVDRAQRELLLLRATNGKDGDCTSAVGAAVQALDQAEATARSDGPVARDFVRAHWILGAAHCAAGDHGKSEEHLNEALERCRRINLVEQEAAILIDLARLRLATRDVDEAERLAEEALIITERSGYVLQGADAHIVLARAAKERGQPHAMREHAQRAKELATCDGPPDYTYKAAYEEASRLLEA